jgi:hypothetical protein
MAMFDLVLQFRGRSVEDLDELLEVEDALFEMLAVGEELDGHEVGAHARNIHIATADAEATFRRLLPFLTDARLLDGVIAAARPFPGGSYTVLWPRAHRAAFSLT